MSNFSLSKNSILRGKNNFELLFTRGKTLSNTTFTLKYHFEQNKNDENPIIQIGFLVRRSYGNAVKRNRLKRLMREVYRHQQHILNPIKEQHGLVLTMGLMVKPNIDINRSGDLVSPMSEILTQLLTEYENHSHLAC